MTSGAQRATFHDGEQIVIIEEIKRKLAECRQLVATSSKSHIQTDAYSLYHPLDELNLNFGAPAEEAEVVAFEKEFNITLPEDYRAFILEIGNGSHSEHRIGIPWYGLYSLQQIQARLDEPFDGFLSETFLYTEYFEDDFVDSCVLTPTPPLNGTMRLTNHGCATFSFLVINGEERGNMWYGDSWFACPFVFHKGRARKFQDRNYPPHDVAAGLPRATFTQWYESWLDHVIELLQAPDESDGD